MNHLPPQSGHQWLARSSGLGIFRQRLMPPSKPHLADHRFAGGTNNLRHPCIECPDNLLAFPNFFGSIGINNALQLRRSEEHTSELQSLMRISYAVFCLKKKN